MKKLALRIDVSKIDKTKIIPREYESNGAVIKEMNYDIELVPVKQEKVLKTTDKYTLVKVAFLSEKSTKNPDGTYLNGTIVGEALEYRDPETPSKNDTGEVADIDSIPF